MTTISLAALACVCAFGVCVTRALMIDEIRGRIQRRIQTSLERTIASLPPELQDAWGAEWRAELAAVIEMPLSALRFVRGARRSTDHLVDEWQIASQVGDHPRLIALRSELTPGRKRLRRDPSNRVMWERCERVVDDVLALGELLADGSHDDMLGVLRLHYDVTGYLLDGGLRGRALKLALGAEQLAQTAAKRHPAALGAGTPLTQACCQAQVQLAAVGQWSGDTRTPLHQAEAIAVRCILWLGPSHPITLDARAVVALWSQWRGQLEATTRLTRALAGDRVTIQGERFHDAVFAWFAYAWALAVAGQREQARRIREAVLEECERRLGRKHRTTLFARALVALSLRDADHPSAARRFEGVLRQRARVLGKDHPDTLWTIVNLALCYIIRAERSKASAQPRQYKKAIKMLTEAIAAYNRALGPDHPDTLLARTVRARAHQRCGHNRVAIYILKDVLLERHNASMGDHPDAIDARAQLAEAYHAQGDVREAITQQRKVVDVSKRVRRDDHPETRRAESTLRQWRAALP